MKLIKNKGMIRSSIIVDNCFTGFVLLNKPTGMSSNAALQEIKRLYHVNKAGHCGSLDPLASGMLPISLGEATKYSQFLLNADKKYRVLMKLGWVSSTGDAEGNLVKSGEVPQLSVDFAEEILKKFQGKIKQIPPMYSALKHKGKPLYKWARQGMEISRSPRDIEIYQIKLNALNEDKLNLEICCSKGTYIRTLIEDIGSEFGCGAYVKKLERLSVDQFTQMITLTEIESASKKGLEDIKKFVYPIDQLLIHWPSIQLSEANADRLLNGQSIPVVGIAFEPSTFIRLFLPSLEFIGMGKILANGDLAPLRMLSVKNYRLAKTNHLEG